MVKFDGIRMQDLIEVQDPDEEGGLTLVFKDDIFPAHWGHSCFLI
jgi:hypothetical protein